MPQTKNLKLKFTKDNNSIDRWNRVMVLFLYTAIVVNVIYLCVKFEVTRFYTLEVMPRTKIAHCTFPKCDLSVYEE